MFSERVASWLFNLDRWWSARPFIVRWRNYLAAKHARYYSRLTDKLLAEIQKLQAYNAQLLMGGKGSRFTMQRRVAKLHAAIRNWGGAAPESKKLNTALNALQYVLAAKQDPDIPGRQNTALFAEVKPVRPAVPPRQYGAMDYRR